MAGISCAGLTNASDFPVGKAIDATTKGCGFFKPLAECGKDFDIVKVDGDKFYNGVFGTDRCVESGRPKSLTTTFFQKLAPAGSKPDIAGIYKTQCTPQFFNGNPTGTHAISELNTTGAKRRFLIHVFSDAACSAALYTVGNENTGTVGNPVAGLVDTYALDVTFTKIVATARSAAGAAFLASQTCAGRTSASDFVIGTEIDASQQGCLFFEPLAVCSADFDIAKVNGSRLHNGVFGDNRCLAAGRPTVLNEWYFSKQ